ncbi:hypothetical protein V8C35DRAFT_326605 [Trichoderma chlorosporum]
MADERPNPPPGGPERKQQPPVANHGRTGRWLPPTIDFLLILNTISKILMVAAMAFLWARTRPLGMFGRRVVAVIAVGDFSLTNLLQMLNDIRSFRFNPPRHPARARGRPKTLTMTKVVVQDDSPEVPSTEVETTETPQDAVEEDPHPIVSQGNDESQGLHSDAPPEPIFELDSVGEAHSARKEKTVPVLSSPTAQIRARLRRTAKRGDASVLPSFDFETTKTPHEDRDGSLNQGCNQWNDCGASDISSSQSWDYLKNVFDLWDDDISTSLFD